MEINMKNAEKIICELEKNGHSAYLVGGCVRDMLMGAEPQDFDITTSARPDEIIGVFSDYKTILTGVKHGTVTVVVDGVPYEVTTFRADGEYSDHRHPESVSFSSRLADDLCRRDFTVNAMAYNAREGVIDLFDGQKDLKNGIIRAVGEPETRFEEDALRILRALRFASQKGFSVEENTKKAIYKKLPLIKYVSAERVFSELKKLLMGKGVLSVLCEFSTVMGEIVLPLAPCIGFKQRNPHHIYDVYTHIAHTVASCPQNEAVRIAALLHDVGKPEAFSMRDGIGHFYGHSEISVQRAKEVLSALKSDKKTAETVLTLIKYHDPVIEPSEKAVRRAMNKMGAETLDMLLSLKAADNLAQAPGHEARLLQYDEIRRIMTEILQKEECFSLKSLAVSGDDIIALGVEKGKKIGEILNRLLSEVIDGELKNEKNALLARVAELI